MTVVLDLHVMTSVGFIPADAPDPTIIAAPLGSILSQLTTGGGAKGVNIDMVQLLT